MKKAYIMKKLMILTLSVVAMVVTYSCTKLDKVDPNNIISTQFQPQSQDVAALLGVAYTNWRTLELGRSANAIWRTNELAGDEEVIPARPNGWVDGGIYRRVH